MKKFSFETEASLEFHTAERKRMGEIHRSVNRWKVCPKCDMAKETVDYVTGDEAFYRDDSQSSGWSSRCKKCVKEKNERS